MKDLFKLILGVLASLFKSRAKLEAEILVLRQQINVLRRRVQKRPQLNNTFAGTALGFERIGAGDRATMLADRRSRLSCARSLVR
jgi:hypothetical protein